ncbi:hypothetical protein, partial [Streptomyces apricus]|uniref:hypothetical protein n=1 Tax=Streptomyces apricus TaxID=1828112 RepID=UPI001CAA8593
PKPRLRPAAGGATLVAPASGAVAGAVPRKPAVATRRTMSGAVRCVARQGTGPVRSVETR